MKYFLSLFICIFYIYNIKANNLLNIKHPEELYKKDTLENNSKNNYLEYSYVADKDILWSKIVWEIIDLNQRVNQPYYLSSDEFTGKSKSLYDVIMEGIRNKQLIDIYDDEYFKNKLTYKQIIQRSERKDTQQYYKDMIADGKKPDESAIFSFKVKNNDIKMIKTKGIWYIDKKFGELKYRLLGIAIMGPDIQSLGTEFSDTNSYVDLFWIWYPSARSLLSKYRVSGIGKEVNSMSYDEMLTSRKFNSIIYKSQTSNGVKEIEEYIPGDAKSQLEESNRIKNEIIQYESDMWNY